MASYASMANVAAIGCQAVVSIATVRLTLPYLGEERFGAWMTVLGISGILTFADLGIGNALITRVAAARAGAAGVPPHVAITGGLVCLLAIGVVASVLVGLAAAVVPWGSLTRVPPAPELQAEFRTAASVFGGLFGAFLFTSGVRKVYEGMQRGYVAHGVMAACSCLTLILLLIASGQKCGIPILLTVTFGVTAVVPGVLLMPLAWAGHFRPHDAIANARHEWRELRGAGTDYSVVQIGSLLLTGSEPMLVASLQGGGALAALSVVQRLFQIAATPARILVAPYWGAYADAHARGDHGYVRRTLIRQISFAGVVTSGIALAMTVSSPWMMSIWTKGALVADPRIVFACCCLCMLDGFMLPFGVYLNGIGCVRPQAAATFAAVFTYFPAKVAALAYGGVAWMIWTTIVFQIANSLLFYVILYRDQVWHAARGE
jgi:O-antigen/teichoic acid export membrane protein